MVEITSEFIFQVLGAKEVELAALRIRVAQLEQAATQTVAPPPVATEEP